jgi:uncharacterized tellurite resistance protein B-like protein
MNSIYQKKLSHLSLLFQVIRSDNEIADMELKYLLRIAHRLGLSGKDVEYVTKEKVPFLPPITEGQRLVLFHQILILIYIDGKIDPKELDFIKELGLKLGLNPYAVRDILVRLRNNPEEGIDPKKITDIFRSFNN